MDRRELDAMSEAELANRAVSDNAAARVQDLQRQREQDRRAGAGGSPSTGGAFIGPRAFLWAMAVAAFLTGLLGLSALAYMLAPTMREFLEGSVLSGAVAQSSGASGNPTLVAVVVAAPALIGAVLLTVGKRRFWHRWMVADGRIRRLQLGVWAFTLARTAAVVAGAVLAISAAGVALGYDLGGTPGSGPFPVWWLAISMVVLTVGLSYPFVRWTYARVGRNAERQQAAALSDLPPPDVDATFGTVEPS